MSATHWIPAPSASQAGLMIEFHTQVKKSPTAPSAIFMASHAGRMTVSHTHLMPAPSASQTGLMTLFQ